MPDELVKYKLTFPCTKTRIDLDNLTFTIGKIKSRTPSVVYFKFYGYDLYDNLVCEHTSNRWVITNSYTEKSETFTLTYNTNPRTQQSFDCFDIDRYIIELYLIGINSENPLYMNHLQLNQGDKKEYHYPSEILQKIPIGFNNNSYVNLYGTQDNFLQIIRPVHVDFNTEELTPAQTTILAPHLPNETNFDNPVALLYEFMYMTEQRIGVEK